VGSYNNLVITAADRNGNSVRLNGQVLVRLPGHIVLNSLKVDNYKTLYKRLSSTSDSVQRSETRQLRVYGKYSDGVERDISSATAGTTYTSGDEKIVTVDNEGRISSQNVGTANITVRNGTKSAEVRVVVKPY
jgi:hypothetical protein